MPGMVIAVPVPRVLSVRVCASEVPTTVPAGTAFPAHAVNVAE